MPVAGGQDGARRGHVRHGSSNASGPSRARSGASSASRAGSTTTTSPNVRGSTKRSSSPARPSRPTTTWVCLARARRPRPARAGRSSAGGPAARRPESSGTSRYFPRRLAADERAAGQPVDDGVGRGSPHGAGARHRHVPDPAADDSRPPALAAPSPPRASSGMRDGLLSLQHGATPSRAAACSACFFERPSPSPSTRPSDPARWRRSAWRGRAPPRARRRPAAARTARRGELLQRRLVVEARPSRLPASPRAAGRRGADRGRRPPRRRRRGTPRRCTASKASDRIDGFVRPPAASSPLPSSRQSPSSMDVGHLGQRAGVHHRLAEVGELALGELARARGRRGRRRPSRARRRRGTRAARSTALPGYSAHHERWARAWRSERGLPELVAEPLAPAPRGPGWPVRATSPCRTRSRRRRARSSGPRRSSSSMRNPTLRSPSSSSSASTSSMRASESASRSSTNDCPSLMVHGSISRMSARRSRTISKTSSRSIGACSTWVSAGTAAPWRWRNGPEL